MAESDQEFSSSTSEEDLESSESVVEDVISITNQVNPYQGEPLASSDGNSEGSEENDQSDEDGLTPALLERRFDKTEPVSSWCTCNQCDDTALVSAREFRCCREVDCAVGKLTFDGSIERISCITQHPDFIAMTNSTVLRLVAPLLRDRNG